MKLKFKKSDEYLFTAIFFPCFAMIGGWIMLSSIFNFSLFFLSGVDWLFILVPGLFFIGGVVGSIYSIKGYSRNQGIEAEIKPDGVYLTKYQELIKIVPWNEIQSIEYSGSLRSRRRRGTGITIHIGERRRATYILNLRDGYGESVLKITVSQFNSVIEYLKLFHQYHSSLMDYICTPYQFASYRFKDVKNEIQLFDRSVCEKAKRRDCNEASLNNTMNQGFFEGVDPRKDEEFGTTRFESVQGGNALLNGRNHCPSEGFISRSNQTLQQSLSDKNSGIKVVFFIAFIIIIFFIFTSVMDSIRFSQDFQSAVDNIIGPIVEVP